MRLDWALNEIVPPKIDKNDPEEVVDLLLKECREYIKEIKVSIIKSSDLTFRGILFRGIHKNKIRSSIEVLKPRHFRDPVDMPEAVHNDLDSLFYDRFGWSVRSEGVFTTGRALDASTYGESCIFFPIGLYKYVWSPIIEDLYGYLQGSALEERQAYWSILKKAVGSYTDKNLNDAIRSGNEVAVWVKAYYVLPSMNDVVDETMKILQDRVKSA